MILHAGNAKFHYQNALKAMKEDESPEKILEQLQEGDTEMHAAHQYQTDLITKEMNGTAAQVNILSVHAQDHLTMATMCKELTEETIAIYKVLAQLRNEIKELKELIIQMKQQKSKE